MNHASRTSLDRVVAQIERRNRRSQNRKRFTTAPLVLAAGLGLSDLLLVVLVPQVWPALLATDPGEALRGWPLLVWHLSGFCEDRQPLILAGIAAVAAAALVLGTRNRLVRLAAWGAAVAVVLADAGIVASTVLACLQMARVST